MAKYSKNDIIRIVDEEDIEFIRLQFTDIFGTLKNVAITASQLEKALDNKCMFDGSSIEGFVRIEESDMYLHPDLDTFMIFPWRPQQGKVARIICDVYMADGTPFEGDPRYILKKQIEKAKQMGYIFNVGPECEFFLFHLDENGQPTTISHERAGYFDLGPNDLGENARRDMVLTLEDMDFEIEASHHEVAPAQHEIDFKYEEDKLGLSQEAYYFIGGIMKHMKGMTVITNPIVNSYKRFVPGYEAPIYITWSATNRSPLIRIPAARGEGRRVELRNPDPSANPYLVLALCLAAGIDGIKNKIQPDAELRENVFELTEHDKKRLGIESLPADLHEAVECLKSDDFIREILGEHIYDKYIEAKEAEWNDYRAAVTQWEIDEYLYKF